MTLTSCISVSIKHTLFSDVSVALRETTYSILEGESIQICADIVLGESDISIPLNLTATSDDSKWLQRELPGL